MGKIKVGDELMIRKYYSSRNNPKILNLSYLYWKFQHLYCFFRDKDFFKSKADITKTNLPDSIKHEAAIALNFQPFPITEWKEDKITEDNLFDTIEFLFDHVSEPGIWTQMTSDDGYNFCDYDSYDDERGKEEFRQKVNSFLCDYKAGYELTKDGIVLAIGKDGLQHIINDEIIPYDEANVDSRVRHAILKWRNRHLALSEKKEAIRELADVFEWLKITKGLDYVLDKKDSAMIFDIANNFGIRHHNPKQKTNYEKDIWYSWIFHFYLATYHATIRLLMKKDKDKKGSSEGRSQY
jgi:hypothetical protein